MNRRMFDISCKDHQFNRSTYIQMEGGGGHGLNFNNMYILKFTGVSGSAKMVS